MTKIYNFDTLANRDHDYSKKWCRKKAIERFGNIPDDYISMWIADMDFELAQPILNRFKELVNNKTFGYIYCYDDFFDSVINWNERKTNYKIKKESITLNYGVVSTLYNIVQAFCKDKNDSIIINSPVYNPFRECAINNNVKIIENNLYIDSNNRYQIDFELLENQIKQNKPKIYIFCSPHNPSGRIWSKAEVTRVAEICYRHGVILVADEVHSDHIHKGSFYSTLSLDEKYRNNLIFLNSANKGFNFAGLKTSYSIIPSDEIKQKLCNQFQRNHIDEPNVFGIAGIVSSYTDEGEDWLNQCYKYIIENYIYSKNFIHENCPQLKLMDMESSYLLWIDVSKTGMDGDEFTKKLAHSKGILVQEGSSFGEISKSFVRINIGTSREKVKKALYRLKEFLDKKN